MIEMGNAPGCNIRGLIMARDGGCFKCLNYGSTSGCS
jgi:ribonucleoside-diphosphate reductase alpha chain